MPIRKKLPRQIWPAMIEAEYAKAIIGVVAKAKKSLDPLRIELPHLLQSAKDSRTDADEGRRARQLVDAARTRMRASLSTRDVESLAETFAQQTQTYQRIQLNHQVHAALGVTPRFKDKKLSAMVDHFVHENASLITTIPDRLHGDIERMVTRAFSSGTLHPDLASEIDDRFDVAESSAKLIARDQIGKLYGQVNAARQQELGVRRFLWRTVMDPRVRPEHADLEGESFSYDDPPLDDDGEPMLPGTPINCRCYAEPDFESVDALSETSDEEPADDSE